MTDKEDSVEVGASSVSDAFKDEPEAESVKEPAEEPSKGDPEEEAEPEPEKAKEAETEEAAEPPSAEQETANESVPKPALLDERRKRQNAERELEQTRAKLKQYESGEDDAPDPVADPKGYKAHVRVQLEKEQGTRIADQSRERMLESHPDYEAMEKHFIALAMADPSLAQKLKTHLDPARFAYDTAKAWKDKTFAEYEKQVIEKLRKEGKLKEKTSAPEVANLINSPGAGKNSDKTVAEVTKVSELFR